MDLTRKGITMPIPQQPTEYFVSFAHTNGFGNVNVTMPGPITGMPDIQELTAFLRRQGISQPIVLHFQPFTGTQH